MPETKKLTHVELFERLVRLEAKIDFLNEDNRRIDRKFSVFVAVVLLLEFVNFIFNLVLYLR